MPTVNRSLAVALTAALLAAVLLLLGPAACQRIRSLSAQARLGDEQLKAAAKSGADAVDTAGRAARRERESEETTRTNEREIRHAEGADDRVHPGVRDAGLRSLCRRAAYRDSERCRLLGTDPG